MPYDDVTFRTFLTEYEAISSQVQEEFPLQLIMLDKVVPLLMRSPTFNSKYLALTQSQQRTVQAEWTRRSQIGFGVAIRHFSRKFPPMFSQAYKVSMDDEEWMAGIGQEIINALPNFLQMSGDEDLHAAGLSPILELHGAYQDEVDTDFMLGLSTFKEEGIPIDSEDCLPAVFRQLQLYGVFMGMHDFGLRVGRSQHL